MGHEMVALIEWHYHGISDDGSTLAEPPDTTAAVHTGRNEEEAAQRQKLDTNIG